LALDLNLGGGAGAGGNADVVRPVEELRWNDLPSLVALARSVVAPKQKVCADARETDHVCRTLAEAFVLALPEDAFRKPHIGLITVVGPNVLHTFTTSNLVVDVPMTHQIEKMLPLESPSIVVFNTSLDIDLDRHAQEPAASGEGQGVQIRITGGDPAAAMNYELALLSRLVDSLAGEGVAVAASQKTIHPFVKQELVQRGIVPIERLSLRHVDAVASSCGVRPVSAISEAILPQLGSHVGTLRKMRVIRLKRKKVLELEPTEDRNMQTVVLTAPSELAMEELSVVSRTVFKVLHAAISSPYVTRGGGCLELILSRLVRFQGGLAASSTREARLETTILESFASTLTLAASRVCGSESKLEDLWKAAGSAGDGDGDGKLLLDLVMVKLGAIEHGVDAACNLARVDSTLEVV